MNIGLKIFLFIFLTVLTQIGGLIYVFSIWVNKKIKWGHRLKPILSFTVLYLIATFLIVPFIAPLFGRERVVHTDVVQPTNYMTVLLNRNYVKPELNELLLNVEHELEGTKIKIHYLDANFPFIDGFPLLPHLSHNDGKKIDISFIYEDENGELSNLQKSMSGYGAYTEPNAREFDQIEKCKVAGYSQYDFSKYLTFGKINSDLIFSKTGTKKLIQSMLTQNSLGKIFIEPHLKKRMNLTNHKIRYHGFGAVRHDDHIHLQLD